MSLCFTNCQSMCTTGSCHLYLCYSTKKTNCRGKVSVKVHDMPSAENNPWKNEKTNSSFQIKRDPIEETFLLHCTMKYFHSVPKWPVEPAPWNCAAGLRENLISFNKLLRFSEEKWHLLLLFFWYYSLGALVSHQCMRLSYAFGAEIDLALLLEWKLI